MSVIISCILITASCHDSCFGNLQTGAAYYDFGCNGNERTLQDCKKVYATYCMQAVGVYCCK